MGSPGRPKKPDHLKRRPRSFSATDTEMEAIDALARAAGVSHSTFIRRSALRRHLPPVVPSINHDDRIAIGRIGHNINQGIRALHAQQAPGMLALHRDLAELKPFLERIVLALAGQRHPDDEGGAEVSTQPP